MNIYTLTHSKEFIQKWKRVLIKLYGYEDYMDFLLVPSLFSFKKTFTYIPLLNYTDRLKGDCDDLVELAKDNAYHIKVLNPDYANFRDNDTVAMRLDISSCDSENIFKEHIKPRCRNKIINAIKRNSFSLEKGNGDKFIEEFNNIFSDTVYKHGTPVFDKQLFYKLRDEFQNDIFYYIVYDKDKPIATMCILFDKDIAWYPWGGIDESYSKNLIGYFIYWKVLEDVINNYDKLIFDFGRSGYLGNTYKFKSQFGAKPVKIDILESKTKDVYSKYSLASNIWKKLPKKAVDFIGPKLCKYLVDL